jgi:hypothetical protein
MAPLLAALVASRADAKPQKDPHDSTTAQQETTTTEPTTTTAAPEAGAKTDVPHRQDDGFIDFVIHDLWNFSLTVLMSVVLTTLILFSLGMFDGGHRVQHKRRRDRDDTPALGTQAYRPPYQGQQIGGGYGPPPSVRQQPIGGVRPVVTNTSAAGTRPSASVPQVVEHIEQQMGRGVVATEPVLLQSGKRRDFISDAGPESWRVFFHADGGRNRGSAKALEAALQANNLMATVSKHRDISTLAIVTYQGRAYAFPLSQGFANIAEYFEAPNANPFSKVADMSRPAVVDPQSHRPQLRGLVTLE